MVDWLRFLRAPTMMASIGLASATLVGCAADAPSVDTLPPARKMRLQFTDYAIAGTHLFVHKDFGDAQCLDCESRSYIEGEDLLGEPITTARLFQMSVKADSASAEQRWLEAPEVARRAMDILLSRLGEPVLDKPGRENGCVDAEEVCALIAPAKLEGDAVTFWINEGSMHPTLTRVEVDLNTAEVKRTPAKDLALTQ